MPPKLSPDIEAIFSGYPQRAQHTLMCVRNLIFTLADEQKLGPVTESVKWGEASFAVKSGTPIRLDWKAEAPDEVVIFFHCQTHLIATFREVYPDDFVYSGNRAMSFALNQGAAHSPLAHCLSVALNYQRVKQLPLLGM
ncbi:DUF1801 domain-containing protein [Gilvimarinus xylanilyticus]|uniref:DUF1801 domain-containing protein n=1 Tax=Gilvimarinus xylanilyticus TaxID=2944139 RepID=A0A9X2I2V8_9GAMM|nr:DUF1801 domain-containing protein [Gilvimarinus xylanilyticus]MCP8897917.1 DUF1801 domain-containing protein [Gilvimarinus xylanilyticus]